MLKYPFERFLFLPGTALNRDTSLDDLAFSCGCLAITLQSYTDQKVKGSGAELHLGEVIFTVKQVNKSLLLTAGINSRVSGQRQSLGG